jgi:hypothetical protein
MRDTSTSTSFVRKVVGAPLKEPDAEPQWRKAFIAEREGSAQAFCISVRSADGREVDGFAMSLYVRHKWLDRDARCERLVLIFSMGAVCIEGQHLQRGLDALEEGKLKRIQAQDSNEIALIRGHNADTRKAEEKEPIISRVLVSPSFESLVESEDSLAEIAGLMKEEHARHN